MLEITVGEIVVTCFGGTALAEKAVDWNPGDIVTIRGVIRDTILGALQVDDCDAEAR